MSPHIQSELVGSQADNTLIVCYSGFRVNTTDEEKEQRHKRSTCCQFGHDMKACDHVEWPFIEGRVLKHVFSDLGETSSVVHLICFN